MEERIYHGNISPEVLAQSLEAHFNRGNLQAQQIGSGDQINVQIATHEFSSSGGHTALTVSLVKVEDGISVKVGQQTWWNIAASLGYTALSTLHNPLSLLGRLDDLAQDIESLQLSDEVWRVIDQTARSLGTGQELSERLQRLTCSYCKSANPVGVPNCIACGAPLGDEQPMTCRHCGFVVRKTESICPKCGQVP